MFHINVRSFSAWRVLKVYDWAVTDRVAKYLHIVKLHRRQNRPSSKENVLHAVLWQPPQVLLSLCAKASFVRAHLTVPNGIGMNNIEKSHRDCKRFQLLLDLRMQRMHSECRRVVQWKCRMCVTKWFTKRTYWWDQQVGGWLSFHWPELWGNRAILWWHIKIESNVLSQLIIGVIHAMLIELQARAHAHKSYVEC